MVKPTLKWAGGKRDLIDEIKNRFPSNFDSYHEPFFGGGALFFAMEPKNGTINDKNKRLINYYNMVKNRPDELISELRSFRDPDEDPDQNLNYNQQNRKGKEIDEYYYQMREIFNNRPNNERFDKLKEAAILQYLNRTCYNGLYRENNKGEFNTPIGRYENPDWVLENRIRKASKALNGTEIKNEGFEYIVDKSQLNDLVYFDPPYKPLSPTANFTEYSAGGFGKEEQNELIQLTKKLDQKGIKFILSNSGIMYDKYVDLFNVDYVMGDRSISQDSNSRGKTKEIIVYNT